MNLFYHYQFSLDLKKHLVFIIKSSKILPILKYEHISSISIFPPNISKSASKINY